MNFRTLLQRALSPIYYSNKGGWWPWAIREPSTGAWQRNQEWTPETVLAHHAVYSCISLLASDIGKLWPRLLEKDARIWEEIENTAHSPVLRRPNRYQNHIQFKETWTTSKLIHGNAYVLLERDGRGVVRSMYLLDPNRVQVLQSTDGAVFYKLKQDFLSGLEEEEVSVPASEIIHDRINCIFHPLVGTSPIYACGTAANMGLKIQNDSTKFFANSSTPSGILSTPVSITPEKSAQLTTIWDAKFGQGQGGVAVLGDGMKFEQMRITAHDSQLIEQLKWTAETVCSTFHVPPWKIGIGSMPAYTKPEIANHAYYSDCLQSHIEQWELCMDRALGLDEEKVEGRWMGVDLNLDGLFRMDPAGQITSLTEGVRGSLLTVNDARQRMDLPDVPGGDSIWMQQQNYSLEALQKRDEKPDPFGTAAPPALPSPEAQKALPAPKEEEEEDTRSWADFFIRDTLALTGT